MKAKAKICAIFVVMAFIFISCNKSNKTEILAEEKISLPSSMYEFYYFSDGGYRKISKVSEAPTVPEKPWTQATRISSISCAAFSDSDEIDSVPKAFALVNRIGLLVFENDSISLAPDTQLFSGRTAGNLTFYDDTPIYSLYRSTFFGDSERNLKGFHPFLVQFNANQNVSYPVVNVENLGFDEKTEITDYIWDGKIFCCYAKTTTDNRVSFSFRAFQPKEHLLSITPESASKNILTRELSAEDFRAVQKIEPFENAPDRIKELLSSLKNSDYLISVMTSGGHSPRKFINANSSSDESQVINAYGLISDSWSAVLFQDGTIFLKGALALERIFNHGNTVVIRLPRLPKGFSYSGFAITGRNLYAAWEETDFYKCARSGFISVELAKILY